MNKKQKQTPQPARRGPKLMNPETGGRVRLCGGPTMTKPNRDQVLTWASDTNTSAGLVIDKLVEHGQATNLFQQRNKTT